MKSYQLKLCLCMVYISRHSRHTRKKNYKGYIFSLILALLVFIIFHYKAELQNLFLGSETKRLVRIAAKIESGFSRKNSSLEDIDEFINLSTDYTKNKPAEKMPFYFLAKGHYYKLAFIGLFQKKQWFDIVASQGEIYSNTEAEILSILEKMYWNSLKALAISGENEWWECQLMAGIGEIFRHGKNPEIVFEFLQKADKIDKGMERGLLWTNITLALLKGDLTSFNTLLASPESEVFQLAEAEKDYLRAYLGFRSRDYFNSLTLLRKSRMQLDPEKQFVSQLLEARIFYNQNLPWRSVEILEKLYAEYPGKEEILKQNMAEFKQKFVFLKSRVLDPTF